MAGLPFEFTRASHELCEARRGKLHIPCFHVLRESKLIPLPLLSKSKQPL